MKYKTKIVFLIPTLDIGGAQKVMSILLNYISKELFDITLCSLTDTGIFFESIPSSVNKIYLNTGRVRYSARSIFKTIKSTNPDVVFVFDVNNLNLIVGILSFFLPTKIKYITREVTILSVFNNAFYRFNKFRNLMFRFTFKRFDLIVCQSLFMKDDLITHYKVNPLKTIVINNPLEVKKLTEASESTLPLLKKDVYNILAVGRLVSVKGYDRLIEVLSKVKYTNFHLTILGDETPEDNFYKALLTSLIVKHNLQDTISFLGFTNNPYKYMAQSDLLVITSRSEGFPNVALEANALGLPILAFNCPGGVSEIISEGFNGWLVEDGDIDKMAETIDKISTLKLDKERIQIFTKEKYDVVEIVPIFEKVILDLLPKE